MKIINHETNMKYLADMYKNKKQVIEDGEKTQSKSYMLDNDVEFVNYFDTMLGLLPAEYERIIRNDYLQPRTVKWWQEFYKKSTYYRRKREAVEVFVDCLSL